jgi:hypothetical protein
MLKDFGEVIGSFFPGDRLVLEKRLEEVQVMLGKKQAAGGIGSKFEPYLISWLDSAYSWHC